MGQIDPDEPGPFAVGACNVMTAGPDGIPLPTEVWYPVAREATGSRYAYLPGLTGLALAGQPAAPGPWPVIVFSHGHTGIRFQSITLAEHLASQGFVVAAPDHIGNTFMDTMQDLMGLIAMRRPGDLAAVFDAITEHPLLAPVIDRSAGYAAVGHSFGGWTALVTGGARVDREFLAHTCGDRRHFLCQLLELGEGRFFERTDPRVWATIALAPTGYPTLGPDGLAPMRVPTLVMGGTEDEITPWEEQQQPIYDGLTCPVRAAARLTGASHYTFSDAAKLAPIDPYTRGSLPASEAHPIIGSITGAFLHRVLGHALPASPSWLPPVDPRVHWLSP